MVNIQEEREGREETWDETSAPADGLSALTHSPWKQVGVSLIKLWIFDILESLLCNQAALLEDLRRVPQRRFSRL